MMITASTHLSVVTLATVLLTVAGATSPEQTSHAEVHPPQQDAHPQSEVAAMKIEYLEIVTSSVDETCEVLANAHGVEFSDPVPEFGNARTADLAGGGRIGVRAPMRETEAPVVRPYVLVDDIEAAVKAAEAGGATVAIPPMAIPGQGTFSIYILGGIEHGLWQR